MRRAIVCCALAATWTLVATDAFADQLEQPNLVAPVKYSDSYARPAAEASPSDQAATYVPASASDLSCDLASCCDDPACGCADPYCGGGPSCGCDPCCSSCGCSDCDGSCCFMGDCDLGDPCTLKDHVCPCSEHQFGGWLQIGYHSDFTRLSSPAEQGLSFNDHPDALNFHQAWLYAEKVAEADACSADWGYRVDFMYGLDASKTQAFGNPVNAAGDPSGWDNSWNHGVYGWALPQLYGEVAMGDWSVKVGHFYTLVGYEVVPATGNFFYSHALTMFNSEPFTHTGAIGTYSASDDVTLYAGWTLGWDTGFEQFGGGSSWLGGVGLSLLDDVDFTYISTAGNLGWRGDGYSHSLVFDTTLTENMNYVLQSDYVNTTLPDGFHNEDVGVNQYLFYSLSDCWAVGGRMEWWKSNNVTGEATSFYELTGGINYKPHANVVVRPEIRYDWSPTDLQDADGNPYNETVFGVDAIFTF